MSVTIYHVNFATGEMIIEHNGYYLSAWEEENRHRQRVAEVEKMEKKEQQKKQQKKQQKNGKIEIHTIRNDQRP